MAFRANSFKFLRRTVNSKPPTMPFGIVACTFSVNLSRNSCIPYPILNIMRIVVFFCCCFSLKLPIGITIAFRSAYKNVIWGWVYVWHSRTKTMITLPVATKQKKNNIMINNSKNDNGNFICVFECTIVNLATYRQFTNAAWDWIVQENENKNKNKTTTTTTTKKQQKNEIKIALSLGYPSSHFYNNRCNNYNNNNNNNRIISFIFKNMYIIYSRNIWSRKRALYSITNYINHKNTFTVNND